MRLAATTKGYITKAKAKFHEYGFHLIKYLKTNCMLGRKYLLIVDGHKSHLYNLPFYELMRVNDIEVLIIPPHTSHLLQPLDSAPFGAFKINWESKLRKYNNEHHGHPLNKVSFLDVFVSTWNASMTPKNYNGWVQEDRCVTIQPWSHTLRRNGPQLSDRQG